MTAVTMAGFIAFAPLVALEGALSDRLTAAARPPSEAQHPGVSVITINEATLAKLPYRSPIDRGFLADVLEAIREAGVKAVAFDILFDQPTEDAKDVRLALAIRDFPAPVTVAWADARAGMTEDQDAWLAAFIDASEAQPGGAGLLFDADGVIRRHRVLDPESGVVSLPAGLVGADEGGPETIAWLADTADGKSAFQVLPAHSIVLMAKRPAILKRWLEGRVVLIGADLPQQDRHLTRLSADPSQPATIPGVVIHAHVAAQMLDGRAIGSPGETGFAILIAAAALLGVLIGFGGIAFWLQIAGGLVLLGIWGAAAVWQSRQGFLLPVAPMLFAYAAAYALAAGIEALLQRREKAFIRNAFGHYVAPQLVAELSRHPDLLKLGGERRRMSFLFSDIAGFTSMSEKLQPEELTSLLNDYLDGMSDIVLAHGGTLDKFIGDAVVAIFGAPVDQPDHARRAMDCALALDHFAEDFRGQHTGKGLGVTRIGVHHGEATVGNFGGRQRFDYTAMGDAMNTAARLEGANKAFGTRVALSGDLLEAAAQSGDLPPFQKVGGVVLKGRKASVDVYTPAEDAAPGLLSCYAEALTAMDTDLPCARDRFDRLGKDWPDNPLVKFHRQRLEAGESGSTFELKEK
ncbi:MAG: CHASE2 domain-containing protein [Minwuia sp.]|uniref:CHASE2 domain-containing protein n=1 Tax=Minwuia sp. TaxID=2493630 RepID=UPI003A8978ED